MIEDITKEKVLNFSNEDLIWEKLKHSPKEYIEQVKKLENPIKLILVDPENSQSFFESLRELVENCDNEICINTPHQMLEKPNKNEFLKAESIINEIISEVDSKWDIKQKIAFVHHKIGKIMSYKPDFNFMKTDWEIGRNVRVIWDAVSSGLGVCNGIADINQTILSRLGIESKSLTSGTHRFLLIKTDEGNIITDPTWDLFRTLYEGKPDYFGKTYEQIREMDGPFTSHLLKQPPENVIEIKEDELREIFHSIGLTNEDKTFPVPIWNLAEQISEKQDINKSEKLELFLQEFRTQFKQESTHICETMSMLGACFGVLGIEKINYQCVYSKKDKQCEKPILVIHSEENELLDKIFIFNDSNKQNALEKMNISEFDKNYKTHFDDNREPFWSKYVDKNRKVEEVEKSMVL